MTDSSIQSERGAALIFALMGMTVLMALGAALVLMTSTETIIAGNFRIGRQAFYAAEAAAELAVAELRTSANWIGIVEGAEVSRFVDGAPAGPRTLPTDAPVDLTAILNLANCSAPAPCTGAPRWQLFAYGALRDLAAQGLADSPFYIVALVSGGQTSSGEPLVTIRAEAFGPRGAHQAVEITVSRTPSGEVVVLRTVLA
jgi:Tfp pilus assembly protein PilX